MTALLLNDRPQAHVTGHPTDGLLLAAVATLPLTQALTVDVGFPLKAYEVLLGLVLVGRLLQPGRARASRLLRVATAWCTALVAVSAVGLAYALIFTSRPSPSAGYRLAPAADGLLQLAYLLLAVLAFLFVAELTARRPRDVVRWWLRGAAFAAAYAVVINLVSLAGTAPLLLPGASRQVGDINGVVVQRAGTFLEGNFFGLYLVASLVFALLVRRRLIALLLTAALLLSLSTLSVAAGGLVWAVALGRDLRSRRSRVAVSVAVLPVLLTSLLLPGEFYQKLFLDKLTNAESRSAIERRATAQAGFDMFLDYPASGVGMAQFGLWFPTYRPNSLQPEYLPAGGRYIANNVYVQVLAEQGAFGFTAFLMLLAAVSRAAFSSRSGLLVIGFGGFLLSLNAFPSVTVVFVWAFFGVIMGLGGRPGPSAAAGGGA